MRGKKSLTFWLGFFVVYIIFSYQFGIIMQLLFKKPTLDDQAQILTFRQEFNAKCNAMHGSNELNAFTDGGFVGWLNYINAPAGENWFDYEKVADSTYVVFLEDKVVGIVHIRHSLSTVLLERGGHVGYSVHPDFWGRGIATKILTFAIDELNKMGVSRVLITCDTTNHASKKVILKNGGILENTINIQTPNRSYYVERYWVG